MNKKLLRIASFPLAILAFFTLFTLVFPPAQSLIKPKNPNHPSQAVSYYTALGDSLTQGVGDSTKEGGFVPLLAKRLGEKNKAEIKYDNFGKAGDTAKQINSRLMNQPKIQDSLKKAKIITVTVGGNDLIKTFAANLTNLKVTSFTTAQVTYQNDLQKLLDEINHYKSAHTKVYVLGIYNPFYLTFSEIPELQTIFDNWNQATQSVIQANPNYYFVPINDILYKGSGISDNHLNTSTNDLLSQYDEFHPNNVGYNLMAKAVFDEYEASK